MTRAVHVTFSNINFAFGCTVVVYADFDAIERFIGANVSALFLQVMMFIDTDGIWNDSTLWRAVALTKLVIAWTAVGTVCVAWAVVAALVQIFVITFVFA